MYSRDRNFSDSVLSSGIPQIPEIPTEERSDFEFCCSMPELLFIVLKPHNYQNITQAEM